MLPVNHYVARGTRRQVLFVADPGKFKPDNSFGLQPKTLRCNPPRVLRPDCAVLLIENGYGTYLSYIFAHRMSPPGMRCLEPT